MSDLTKYVQARTACDPGAPSVFQEGLLVEEVAADDAVLQKLSAGPERFDQGVELLPRVAVDESEIAGAW